MEIPFIKDLLIIFGLALAVVLVSRRVKAPVVVGLLLTGVIAGPHGLGAIEAKHEVEVLAEIGVVLLLFTIGIEFSLARLMRIKATVLIGGGLQVAATLAAGAAITMLTGRAWNQAIFFGCLLALSSTAIVLKLVQERAEVDSPHGGFIVGALIFQDVAVVPMMLLIPILSGQGGADGTRIAITLGKALLVVGAALFLARTLVPRVLYQAARLQDSQLFMLAVVSIGLGVAWLTSAAGLSLALGAFLAGLIISESEYQIKVLADVLPLRDVFTSLFFVSVGMLLDIGFFLTHPALIVLLALGVHFLKTLLAGSSAAILGLPFRLALLGGLAVSQVGEFSFILARAGVDQGLMDAPAYQFFLGVSVLTMIATPFIISSSERVSNLANRLPMPAFLRDGRHRAELRGDEVKLEDHLVIVGFGPNGRNLARAAEASRIPFAVIELNPSTVRRERERGTPIYYGDAAQEHTLEHARVVKARVLVVAVPDPAATRRVVHIARKMNPRLFIIARTAYIREVDPLYELGASEVIPAELETSVEIFTRVLARYLVPADEIKRYTSELRSGGYGMFRSPSREKAAVCDLRALIPDLEVAALKIEPGSEAAGKSPADLSLRKVHGVTLLAIRRGQSMIQDPGAFDPMQAEDIAILTGPPDKMARAAELFAAKSIIDNHDRME